MKTRRRNIKTPAKGRRSSIICVRKSPIARRNPRRNVRNTRKSVKLTTYESPLVHLYHNGPPDEPQTPTENKQVKNEKINEEAKLDEEETKCNIINLPSSSRGSIKLKTEIHNINEENKCEIDDTEKVEENIDMEYTEVPSLPKGKKRSLISRIGAGEIIKPRKRKVKKSPLSKINEMSDINNFSDSVIFIDDSEFHPSTEEASLNNSVQDIKLNEPMRNISFNDSTKSSQSTSPNEPLINSMRGEHVKNSVLTETVANTEDIVIIDCHNEDSFMEMEAYHDAFKSGNSSSDSKFMDSIIVIDHDDDPPPIQTDVAPKPTIAPKLTITPKPTVAFMPTIASKPSEDCFVVWSSLPKPCTSNNASNTEPHTSYQQPRINAAKTEPHTSYQQPWINAAKTEPHTSHQQPWINAAKTEPHTSYQQPWINNADLLKCDKILLDTTPDKINLKYLNNENDKPKKKTLKSPKVNPKKTLTKVAAKTRVTKATVKSATKTTTKASAKATTKAATKTTATTTLRKRVKNNGELIFTSETKEGDESEETKKKKPKYKKGTLREIVIDGSNVAMAYTHNKMFSEKGIKMLIDYFTKKGHTVKVFIPQYRRSRNFPLLEKWHHEGIVVFTPSRKLGTKFITSYDDRYILEYATTCDGIVVSQDQFRDLYAEKPQYRDTIENRLLVPTFVGDYVMFPEDPLGRDGPTLKDFLKH